jgi:hypothetical protein
MCIRSHILAILPKEETRDGFQRLDQRAGPAALQAGASGARLSKTLRGRMERRGFPPQDEVCQLVERAYCAVHPSLPYFQPFIVDTEIGLWYLAKDCAFCERARRCGFKIMADTRIRLWHIGSYKYGWEDAGVDRERYVDFTLTLGGGELS